MTRQCNGPSRWVSFSWFASASGAAPAAECWSVLPLHDMANDDRSADLLQQIRDLTERSVVATEEWRRELRQQHDESQKLAQKTTGKLTLLIFVIFGFGVVIGILFAVAVIFGWSAIRTAIGGA